VGRLLRRIGLAIAGSVETKARARPTPASTRRKARLGFAILERRRVDGRRLRVDPLGLIGA
jgi:hypothetical protein